jgi:hypothetical protein
VVQPDTTSLQAAIERASGEPQTDAKKGSWNQDFDFIENGAFAGQAGELHYRFTGADANAFTRPGR